MKVSLTEEADMWSLPEVTSIPLGSNISTSITPSSSDQVSLSFIHIYRGSNKYLRENKMWRQCAQHTQTQNVSFDQFYQ